MKRIGKRGEGRFGRISWEEAFDTIADNLKRIKKDYGNEAIYINYATTMLTQGGTVCWVLPVSRTIAPFRPTLSNSFDHYLSSVCFKNIQPFIF